MSSQKKHLYEYDFLCVKAESQFMDWFIVILYFDDLDSFYQGIKALKLEIRPKLHL